jgi:hypothetical protein
MWYQEELKKTAQVVDCVSGSRFLDSVIVAQILEDIDLILDFLNESKVPFCQAILLHFPAKV